MRTLGIFAITLFSFALLAQSAPAVFHLHDVILFQGDSITDGGRQRTGSDYNHIMGQDYGYIIAANVGADHPELELAFINRGVSGDRVPDLAARWQTDTLDLKPDFLSILVGINDRLAEGDKNETVGQFHTIYEKLLSNTIAVLPHTTIVLGEPFILPVGRYKENYPAFLSALKQRQDVVLSLAAKYHLSVVMYQDAFNHALANAPASYWSWDGIHPTYAGQGLMVREWLKTVAALSPNR
jgi:lysophospholipase L1-like esterase